MNDGSRKNQEQKRQIGEQLWLHYYNQVLFDRGLITEDERNKMANRINTRNAVTAGRKSNSLSC